LFFSTIEPAGKQQIMVASYRTSGDTFEADKPREWSTYVYVPIRGPLGQNRRFALHPDGERMALPSAGFDVSRFPD
jgi:hypothetical protein